MDGNDHERTSDNPAGSPTSLNIDDVAKEIFDAASDFSPEERRRFLDARCTGNADLRQAVESLLKAHDEAGAFFANPTSASPPDDSAAGQHVGRYKLLQRIGEGGFGTVYMAEQEQPVRRRVALKIIKLGMDTKAVIARFEAERQALAMMDHPNIARVFDAGATETGRPYFVMELVHGIPITDYCDTSNLSTRDRLELFVPVCRAVQHAHQKGIIHRDIKPSNVLVTLHDGVPVPKVIDFGIAKATSQRLTEKTLFTEFRQFVGTLEYMSPEQAEMSGLDIDTRSDIYALGVLLYELLTGITPFDAKTLRGAAYGEIQRIIREDDPPRPSTRISHLGETLAATAAHRGVDSRKLSQLMRGELDWIVMKCMEKDRTRRYESANGLARDVERHLRDEAVHACPPSKYYRFHKFARRNRRAVLTASLVAVALLMAVVILAVSNARITSEKNQKAVALREREAALHEKEGALKDKGVALDAARASETDARFQGDLARRRFYASQMNLAMQAWDAGQPARMLQLLESQRPRFDQEDLRGFDWYYLWRLCQGTYRFSLPTRNVDNSAAMAISPDGNTLASGYGQTVRLWDLATGRQTGELPGHDFLISGLAFAPDGNTLASADQQECVRLWDLATGKLRTMVHGGRGIKAVQFWRDSGILVLAGKSLKLWDVVANQEVTTLGESKHEGFVYVAVTPDGTTIAASDQDGIRIWTRDQGAWRESPPLTDVGYDAPVAISADGKLLAVGCDALKLYDLPSLRERIAFQGHTGPVFAVAFAHDGKRLASGGQDRTVRVWDVATGKQQGCIANPGPVYGVAMAPDASVVAAMGTDAIRVWDVATPPAATVLHRAVPVYAVAFSPDGKALASDAEDGTKLSDPANGREIATLGAVAPPYKWSSGLAFSPDGKSLATCGVAEGTIDIWEVTGRRLAVLAAGVRVRRLAFSPDGRSLAEAGGDGSEARPAAVWDLASQQRRLVMPVMRSTSAVAFSPDGKTIAVGAQFGVVKLFDAQSGRERTTLQRFVLAVDWIKALAFSPDGRKLATGNEQGVVHIWDVATNQLEVSLIGHTDAVQSLAFADGGRTLATASDDRTVRLWDVATGQERIALKGHNAEVTGVAFAPDGNVLATSSEDGTVRLWRVALDADAHARKREVDPDDAQSPAAHNERGDRLWQYGRVDEAEAAYRQAMDRLEKLRVAFPDDPAYAQEMVRSLLSISLLLRVERDPHPQAEPPRIRALAIYRKLSPEDQAATFWAYSERQRNLYDSGNAAQFNRTISQMIELIPANDVGWLMRGARHLTSCDDPKLRDLPRGIELARRAVAVATKDGKDRADALACLGDILESNQRSTDAKEIYQKALVQYCEDSAVAPERSDAWTGRAFAHFHLQQWELAIADFSKAIELDPQVHTNWFHRGHAYIALGQWDKAEADFTKATQGWPDNAASWYELAVVHAQLHRPADAVADLRQAVANGFNDVAGIKSDATFEPIRANDEFEKLVAELEIRFRPALDTVKGAEYLRNAGELDEAIKVCSEILSQKPDDDTAWLERANCYLRKRAFAKAVEDFTQVIKLQPDSAWAWHERGYCYLNLGQHEKAIVDDTKTIELGDTDAGERVRRGYSYEALGDLAKAEEDYSRAIELNPDSGEAWWRRSLLHARQGQADTAKADLSNAIAHCSDNPNDQNGFAWELATNADPKLRDPKTAVELAEKAVAARPRDGNIWNTLGVAQYRVGNWRDAITSLNKSAELSPRSSPYDSIFIAMAYQQLGQTQDARQWYDRAVQSIDQSNAQNNHEDGVELDRFRAEAEALIGPSSTTKPSSQPRHI